MKVTILGCGGSGGVPLASSEPGGDWGACDPGNPKNRRRRVSILVEEAGMNILVDTSPDLRLQLLDNGFTRIDAVFFTHAHADHCHGLDELRWLRQAQGREIDAYMDARTRSELTVRFPYVFASSADPSSLYPPLLRDRVIERSVKVGPINVRAFEQIHGRDRTLGFRFGDLAYSTDVSALEDQAVAELSGLKLWIVDCLRDRPHPTHSHYTQTMEWIANVKPERALLTHMNQDLDYEELRQRCPPGVEPAYDGLQVEI